MWYVCVCSYVYECVCVSMYALMCMPSSMPIHNLNSLSVCPLIPQSCGFVCIYVYMYVWLCIYVFMCIYYVFMYLFMCVGSQMHEPVQGRNTHFTRIDECNVCMYFVFVYMSLCRARNKHFTRSDECKFMIWIMRSSSCFATWWVWV
jgi:hypothetical protein